MKNRTMVTCFQFLLGITVVPREIADNGYEKFWEVNKVHYGLCENGECWMDSKIANETQKLSAGSICWVK